MNSTENLCQWDWKCNECGDIVSGMEEQFRHHSLAHWGFVCDMKMELTWTKIKREEK